MHPYPMNPGAAYAVKRRLEKSHPDSKFKVVGSNGNCFVEETRVVSGTDRTIMHGRPLGRHAHQRKDRRIIHPKPRVIR